MQIFGHYAHWRQKQIGKKEICKRGKRKKSAQRTDFLNKIGIEFYVLPEMKKFPGRTALPGRIFGGILENVFQ